MCSACRKNPRSRATFRRCWERPREGSGFFHGNGVVVTWAIGHLVHLAEPHQIDPAWKEWRRSLLPMLPGEWPLIVDEERADQFGVVKKILNSPKIERVVCATDGGAARAS